MATAMRFPGFAALALVCSRATVAAQQAACNAEADASIESTSASVVPGRESVLLQLHQDADKVRVGLGQRASPTAAAGKLELLQYKVVATQLRASLASPEHLASCLASGLNAVHKAVVLFSADPPQLDEGLDVLASGVIDPILKLVPEKTQQTEDFQKFMTALDSITRSFPSVLQDFSSSISAYKNDGNMDALLGACVRSIQALGVLITQSIPEEVAVEVVRHLGAVEDALEALGDALEDFLEGDTTAAVQSLYTGVRQASSELLSPEVLSDDVFQGFVAALDLAFENLSETLLKFRQKLLESAVCWKAFSSRDRIRPDRCPKDHQWDGDQWCLYDRHASEDTLETSVGGKRHKPRNSAVPATCDQKSDFSTLKGSWCYKDCPRGSEPVGMRCRSVCMGDYPEESSLMCGNSPGTLAAAITEMTTQTLRTDLTTASVVSDSGVAGLDHTVSAFVDLGVMFTYPACD